MLMTLRSLNLFSVAVRMVLAVLCGGAVGVEREYKRRPAGFRTHILICLGAAMTTMTSQYLLFTMHYFTDISRMGAQVVAGIGFIGAGTIIVTQRRRVKGLTTAAGLWTSAIVGLCIGAGFYEGGVLTTLLILTAELFFSKMEYRFLDHVPEINLYMEYEDKQCLESVLQLFREQDVKVLDLEITCSTGNETHNACAIFALRLRRHDRAEALVETMTTTHGVLLVQEL